MMTTLLTLVGTIAGLFLVLGAWSLIQSYFRYKSGCGDGRDLLEYMAHGCAGCKRCKDHHHETV
jgi:hypothetical protein